MKWNKYIGNRQFYKTTLAIALPIVLQNAVTNFVSLLDNVMVGQTGLESMTGVSVVSQLMFVFYVVMFGTASGPGIFCAQFYGARDEENLKAAYRFKLLMLVIMGTIGIVILKLFDTKLISYYLNDTGDGGDPVAMMAYARDYLAAMLWGLPAFCIGQAYSTTLREVGNTRVPMIASLAAVAVNLVGNWILIFGNLGAPELGVTGAAIATSISRYVELAILVIWSHRHSDQVLFTRQVYRSFRLPAKLGRVMLPKSMPLLANEVLWSTGQAFLLQLYSLRGLNVMAALNISFVFLDLCNVMCMSLGNVIGIMVGQLLGAGELEEAVDTDRKLIVLTLFIGFVVLGIMAAFARLFPMIYEVTDAVRDMASQFILVWAYTMPILVLPHAFYFTIRSGGKTLITFLFDSAFTWVVNIPIIYVLAHFTGMPVVPMYLVSNLTSIIKCVVGFVMVVKRMWVVNLAEQTI